MDFHADVMGMQLEPLLQQAEQAGIDVGAVLEAIGHGDLSCKDRRRSARLSLAAFFRIEGAFAHQLGDLTASLSERKLTYETGAFITAQMRRSTTLSDALSSLAQYFNMMHAEPYNSVRTTARRVSFLINDDTFPYRVRDDVDMVHFVGECVLIKVFCLLDSLSGGLAARGLRRVAVKRPTNTEAPGHLKFWHVPIVYGQAQYELCFDHEIAHARIPPPEEIDISSEGIFASVIAYLEQASLTGPPSTVTLRTRELILEGLVQQHKVAHRLRISVATLRRRLEEEGTSFRDLVHQHQLERATALLKKGHSVAYVSDLLNYSDVRAFNRAFKRWTGETPATFVSRSRGSQRAPERNCSLLES